MNKKMPLVGSRLPPRGQSRHCRIEYLGQLSGRLAGIRRAVRDDEDSPRFSLGYEKVIVTVFRFQFLDLFARQSPDIFRVALTEQKLCRQ